MVRQHTVRRVLWTSLSWRVVLSTVALLFVAAFLGAKEVKRTRSGTPLAGPERALIEAARQGHVKTVESLIRNGADANACDSAGFTPLIHAATEGHGEVARALVRAGADVNASSPAGWTALLAATSTNDLDLIRLLLNAGAVPDAHHRFWGTALDVAESHGHRATATLLRSRGARGSGKSSGDTVCVRPWKGQGFCGSILAVDGIRYRLRVTLVEGCSHGCAADAECSEGRRVGGGGIGPGDVLWTMRSCLTHTAVAP